MLDLATVEGEGSRHQLREAAEALLESQQDISCHLLTTQQICQPSLCPFIAQNEGQHSRAIILTVLPNSTMGYGQGWVMQWHRLPTSMLFSQLQVCRDFLGTHGQMQTLPWFVQHIFAKEKAILPLSSPPSLPAKEQQESSPGMHWHKVVAFPKKHPETLKAQQNPRFPPAEGLSAIQLQGKGWESSLIH